MKSKRPVALLIIAILLLLAGVGLLAIRANQTRETTPQAQTLSDWAHGSSGLLKVMVSYPTELLINQNNTITLTFESDSTLEQNLSSGYIFDAEFDASGSVITPRKRILTPLERGRHKISWEIVPFAAFDMAGVIKMALGDNNLSGTYAISHQVTFEMPFQLRKSINQHTSLVVGLVFIGLALLLLLVFFLKKKTYQPKS